MTLNPDKLRLLMDEHGLTQVALATLAGVQQSNVSAYLAGQTSPRAVALAKLAAALGAEPEDLCGATPGQAKTRSLSGTVTVPDAAALLGISQASVKDGLLSGKLPIGCVLTPGKKRRVHKYVIFAEQLRTLVGAERFDQYFSGGGDQS